MKGFGFQTLENERVCEFRNGLEAFEMLEKINYEKTSLP